MPGPDRCTVPEKKELHAVLRRLSIKQSYEQKIAHPKSMGTSMPEAQCSRKFSVCRSPAPVMYPVTDTAAMLAAKLARIARNSSGPPALRSRASLRAKVTGL